MSLTSVTKDQISEKISGEKCFNSDQNMTRANIKLYTCLPVLCCFRTFLVTLDDRTPNKTRPGDNLEKTSTGINET